jgi:transcriptional regulator with XRE-family HTH domain
MTKPEAASSRASAAELGQYLRLLRVKLGLTMVQAAAQGGLTQGYLSQIENGLYQPSGRILAKLARVYQIPEVHLLSRAGLVDPGLAARMDPHPSADHETAAHVVDLTGPITAEQLDSLLQRNMRLLENIAGQISKGSQVNRIPAAEYLPEHEGELPAELSLPLYDGDWRPVLNAQGEPAALHVPASLCNFDREAFILCVGDASMEPRIRSGDWVVISPASDPEPGQIAAVNDNNHIHLRQVTPAGDQIALLALNHEYATSALIEGASEGVDVLGRVLRIINREL